MRLAEWLQETGSTQTWLAREVGVTQGCISQIARGRAPSLKLAAKIKQATKDAVAFDDLLEVPG